MPPNPVPPRPGADRPVYQLVWGPARGTGEPRQQRASVSSAGELARMLADLERLGHQGAPFVVQLVRTGKGRLGIGLGSGTSFATFESSDGQPPYWLSRGTSRGTDPLVFFLDGEWTELPPEAAIDVHDAIDAMMAFLSEGQRPGNLSWTEV